MRDFIKPQLRLARYIEFQYNRARNHSRSSHNGNGHSLLARAVKIPDYIVGDEIPIDILDPDAWGYKVFMKYEGWVEVDNVKIKFESQPFNISKVTCYGQRVGTIDEFEKDTTMARLDLSLARSNGWKNILQMVNGEFFIFDQDHKFQQILPLPQPPQS